jgi:hypothetical protein
MLAERAADVVDDAARVVGQQQPHRPIWIGLGESRAGEKKEAHQGPDNRRPQLVGHYLSPFPVLKPTSPSP